MYEIKFEKTRLSNLETKKREMGKSYSKKIRPEKVKVLPKSNNERKNSSSDNSQPFSRKSSFVTFAETKNRELRVCENCEKINNDLFQYNQCIECGNFHCGFHRSLYHGPTDFDQWYADNLLFQKRNRIT